MLSNPAGHDEAKHQIHNKPGLTNQNSTHFACRTLATRLGSRGALHIQKFKT